MKLKQIKEILKAKVLTCEEGLEREVNSAFGSDLMSDVLAFVDDRTILLTGIVNPQVVRTAEMTDLFSVVFVRGKTPSEDILKMASSNNITLMTTEYTLYTSCGKLYSGGLKGIDVEGELE